MTSATISVGVPSRSAVYPTEAGQIGIRAGQAGGAMAALSTATWKRWAIRHSPDHAARRPALEPGCRANRESDKSS